jgi:hypothetical protein
MVSRLTRAPHPLVLAAVAVVAVALTVSVGLVLAGRGGGTPAAHTSASAGAGLLPAGFEVGVAHNQDSLDGSGDPAAMRRVRSLLGTLGPAQDVRLMGWGADNPEPSPGRYDWASLDRRLARVERTGGVPVVTLAAAPDWMKGGRAGHTDWNDLDAAPLPAHYQDFADLAVALATRHPEVRYFQIWSDYQGFYDDAGNHWDYRAYTAFYNTVYDALHAHDPNLRIGGSDVPVDSWHTSDAAGFPSTVRGGWGIVDQRGLDAISYWLGHKHGAQFVAMDTALETHDGHLPPTATAVGKYRALDTWVRGRTRLPVWWSLISAPVKAGSERMSPATLRASLTALRDSGAAVAFFWSPQCVGTAYPCLWTDTATADGGEPTDLAPVARDFSR